MEKVETTPDEAPRPPRKHQEYDDIFAHVRSFGRYQVAVYISTNVLFVSYSAQFVALVFVLGTPMFHCATPNVTCPARKCCANCTEYVFDGPMSTTVAEWSLICDRAYLGATLQSCYFAGMMIGSLLTGMMSDAWGRKKCIFINYAVMLISGVASSFVDCISLFAFLRFIVGFSLPGVMLTLFVLKMELLGPKRRTLASQLGGVIWLPFGMIFIMFAYFIRYWRHLLLVYTAPGFLAYVFMRWFPESPRWLLAKGRLDEAYDIIIKFGPKKGKDSIDTEALKSLLQDVREGQIESEKNSKRINTLDLVRSRKIRKWTLIMAYKWFAVACVYFGIYLFLSQLAGDLFVNYILMTVISWPVGLLQWYLLLKFGRRMVQMTFFSLAGLVLLVSLAIYKDFPTLMTALALVGSFCSDASFIGVYLLTNELFPTILRNTATGAGSMSARIGAIISPYVAMTGQFAGVSMALPVIIFGALALAGGLLTLFLPETLLAKLHQTTEEVENAEDYYGLICWGKPFSCRGQIKAQDTKLSLEEIELGGEEKYNKMTKD